MAASLAQSGVEVHVATTIEPKEAAERNIVLGEPVPVNSWTCHYFSRQSEFYKVSLPLRSWLREHVRDYDLIHVHALFSFAPLAACWEARRAGVPYIVRPLGLLNQWGMKNRRRHIKALSFRFVEGPLLNDASAIHYTSVREQQEASTLNLKARPFVIPLGIDTSPFHTLPEKGTFEKKFPQTKGQNLILFLSRLDPKKGLEILLPAMKLLAKSHPNTLLVMAGSGTEDYTTFLHSLVEKLDMQSHVLWTGFLGHEDKCAALGAADIFVLPSQSENFGIALLEAMAAGKPCLATAGVALGEEAAAAGAIRLTAHDAPSLASALADLLASPDARASLGKASQALADGKYSLEAMGTGLVALYNGIVR
jgi:glycosyltransferase involved in cell wall biosynthesis